MMTDWKCARCGSRNTHPWGKCLEFAMPTSEQKIEQLLALISELNDKVNELDYSKD